ncbi:MAG TPA: DUF1697 domain-containing protein [Candidatus Saccharimonadales bacterium]|nr:DUF1697 domain-containing protein [Candidatus Saccharimonadales bacterium]
MTKYVAFLRGIGPSNPNMHGSKLVGVLEDQGFQNVRSFISSGNVLFETDRSDIKVMETELETAWPKKLGFNSTTFIRSQAELKKLLAADSFKGLDHNHKSYLLVTFFKNKPKLNFILPYRVPEKPYELLEQLDNSVSGVVDISTGKTPDYMVWLERQFGKEITSRTIQTIRRILQKMA